MELRHGEMQHFVWAGHAAALHRSACTRRTAHRLGPQPQPSDASLRATPEQIGSVESVKAASDIYSPVSGVVESVNTELGDQPGLLNKSPLENGE